MEDALIDYAVFDCTGHGMTEPRIAVLLPCYNEEAAIAQTVAGFRAALPGATIYVFDNNSRDCTVELARGAGAEVRTERMQGKGNVVRRMFADVDADIYVMADGDLTYDPAAAPAMVGCVTIVLRLPLPGTDTPPCPGYDRPRAGGDP